MVQQAENFDKKLIQIKANAQGLIENKSDDICPSKRPPVKTGGIAVFGRCPPACGGYFHPPVETSGIKIGRINSNSMRQHTNKVLFIIAGIILGLVTLSVPWKFSLVFAVGRVVALLIMFNHSIGFLLTVAVIPFEMLGALSTLGPKSGVTSVSVIKILGVLTAFSWLIHTLRTKAKIVKAPQLSIIICLIGLGIISICFMDLHFNKKAYGYLLSYVIYLGIFFMTINIIKTDSLLNKLVTVLMIVGIAASLFSFDQR